MRNIPGPTFRGRRLDASEPDRSVSESEGVAQDSPGRLAPEHKPAMLNPTREGLYINRFHRQYHGHAVTE
jgi:hypothetical protein